MWGTDSVLVEYFPGIEDGKSIPRGDTMVRENKNGLYLIISRERTKQFLFFKCKPYLPVFDYITVI